MDILPKDKGNMSICKVNGLEGTCFTNIFIPSLKVLYSAPLILIKFAFSITTLKEVF